MHNEGDFVVETESFIRVFNASKLMFSKLNTKVRKISEFNLDMKLSKMKTFPPGYKNPNCFEIQPRYESFENSRNSN